MQIEKLLDFFLTDGREQEEKKLEEKGNVVELNLLNCERQSNDSGLSVVIWSNPFSYPLGFHLFKVGWLVYL